MNNDSTLIQRYLNHPVVTVLLILTKTDHILTFLLTHLLT
jgi:hypothetical protein